MDSWSEFLQMLLQQSVQKIQQQLGQIQKLGRVCVTEVGTNTNYNGWDGKNPNRPSHVPPGLHANADTGRSRDA